MSTDEKLSKIFDIEPISGGDIVSREIKKLPAENAALEDDYNTTRNNLHCLLQQGQDALFHALEVAKQSEHPRAFEVVGNLMKNLSDINHQLLDLHTKKNKLTVTKEETNNITNNSIFVGSTAELSKMIENLKKGKTE